MLCRRATAIGAASIAATCFSMATASAGAGARIYIPWTEQTVFALGPTDSYVAEWNGPGQGGWTVVGGPAYNIYAGPYGLVAMAADSEDTLLYNGTPNSWTEIGSPAASIWPGSASIAVSSNAVYRINPPNAANVTTVDEWTAGTTWTPILTSNAGDDILDLMATDAGVYLYDVTATTDYFLKYNGTPNSWSQISEGYDDKGSLGPIPSAESRTALYGYMVDPANGVKAASVEIYSGSGTSWTVIGGPADVPLAAGD